jgi:hypothetical protein
MPAFWHFLIKQTNIINNLLVLFKINLPGFNNHPLLERRRNMYIYTLNSLVAAEDGREHS